MKKISIIVPCFNEKDSIPAFYQETTHVLKQLNCEYEILFINDGSTDESLEIIKEFANKDRHILYLSLSRNFGKESAMYAGFLNCEGDYIAIMDVDLQDPPAMLPKMIDVLESDEYDSVATRRLNRNGEPPIRSWFAKMFYKLINKISDADIVDGARDFRLMNRKMVDAIIAMSEYNRFSKGIFGWVGFRTKWISYENVERVAGETKWSFWKLFKYALDGVINFSQAPLSIASWMGSIMTIFSFLSILYISIRKIFWNDSVTGWASMICVVVFIGGIQLLILGIIGQYLSKTYMETKNRPHYIASDSNIKKAKSIG